MDEILHTKAVLNGPELDWHHQAFILHLADNSLIMGHRLSEWTGHGPMLEQDIALTNIALDLIGQSRNFYQYSALVINASNNPQTANIGMPKQGLATASEDSLAYLRDSHEFKNIILAELPNGDWATTILKVFFFSVYQFLLYQKLANSADRQLSAIAEKSLKEVTYHVRWSSEWVIRLGDGTTESHKRLQQALDQLWIYTKEMFIATEYETACASNNIGCDVKALNTGWLKIVHDVFWEATFAAPDENDNRVEFSGKNGLHTQELSNILLEMQFLQRTYPGCEW